MQVEWMRPYSARLSCQVKPWHFGALSGIVMIYAGSRDSQSARLWASPHSYLCAVGYESSPCGLGQHAVREAMESLHAAENRVVGLLAKPDEHSVDNKKTSVEYDDDDDDDAWQ
jgi:hypothetical protein